MKENLKQILVNFGQFLLICAFLVLSVGLLYLDANLWESIPEESFVEFTQELFIMSSSLIFAVLAVKKKRPGLWLVSGFLGCMFIRELDQYFDLLFHGSWFYFALAYAAVTIFLACRKGKEECIRTLAEYMSNRYFTTMACGLAIVLAYSRLIGMKIIWMIIMKEKFTYYVKNVIEESTELVGYSIIMVAALQYAYSLYHERKLPKD